MASIPDIKVTHYDLCGTIRLATGDFSNKRQVALTHGPESVRPQTTKTDDSGRFCFQVQPGEYRLSPLIMPTEQGSGLVFSLPHIDVTVNKPIIDIEFTQALVSIHGSVLCKKDCDSMVSVSLASLDDQSRANRSVTLQKSDFMFEKVLPGKYQVEIKHQPLSNLSGLDDDWCWEEKSIDVNVGTTDFVGISFVQKGYWMHITSTHDVSTRIVGPKYETTNFVVKKGLQKICLESSGSHTLHFIDSCVFFGMDSLSVDIPTAQALKLIGQKYLVHGEIHVDLSFRNEANELSDRIAVDVYEGRSVRDSIRSVKLVARANASNDIAIYQYTYWARLADKLAFAPRDLWDSPKRHFKKILFYPRVQDFAVVNDGCQPSVPPFVGRVGRYIQGSVIPGIAGVDIKIFAHNESPNGGLKMGDLALSSATESDGSFNGGPLYDDADYYVQANKSGYHLKSLGGFNFSCQKLSQILVYINVGEGAEESLPPVLLSLSGEDGYRNNAVTDSGEGHLAHHDNPRYMILLLVCCEKH
eukprot:TRINITY_DN5591_c0_g1_i2.p1 TRINITY_DN5591_c0_g1~~TRINITY_DN5591_c0_g1_i2.p1  ORF type:complete len:565 (+),score=94.86 TRINITY_DN5591_c0_g1_i2:113-1696(+)